MSVLSYPLTPDLVQERLPIASLTMFRTLGDVYSRSAGGEVIVDKVGNDLWQGRITLGRMTPREAQGAEAIVEALRGPAKPFMVYPAQGAYPAADPDGSALSGFSPTLRLDPARLDVMAIRNLPIGYKLRTGDYIGLSYGNPVRYSIHRLVGNDVSFIPSVSRTGLFSVAPNMSPLVTDNHPVTLIKPSIKAIMIPDSFTPASKGRFISEGLSFDFIQTLR